MSDEDQQAALKWLEKGILDALGRAHFSGLPAYMQFAMCVACALSTMQATAIHNMGRMLTDDEVREEFLNVLKNSVSLPKLSPEFIQALRSEPLGSHEGKAS
jgi:hypothetical protein